MTPVPAKQVVPGLPNIHIPGLPEGVEVVRFGVAEPHEFEMHGDMILKGARGFSQVIVQPAEGFEFLFNPDKNHFVATRKFSPGVTQKIVRAEFSFPDGLSYQKGIHSLKRLPHLISITETEE